MQLTGTHEKYLVPLIHTDTLKTNWSALKDNRKTIQYLEGKESITSVIFPLTVPMTD